MAKLTSSKRFNGDQVGCDVGVDEVYRPHEEDDEDCLPLGPASQLEVGQSREPVVLGCYDGPRQGTRVGEAGLGHCKQT